MSKVILTQKQARMFENHKYAVEELLEKRVCDNCPTSIDSLPIDDVVKAIVYGYEVEPEFTCDVGDWIKDTSTGAVFQIKDMQHRNNTMDPRYTTRRHATPEEIAEEKERRWWKKHGRDVWKLKVGDVLVDTDGEILEVTDERDDYKGYYLDYCSYSLEMIKNRFIILTFAESRLDVKTNE